MRLRKGRRIITVPASRYGESNRFESSRLSTVEIVIVGSVCRLADVDGGQIGEGTVPLRNEFDKERATVANLPANLVAGFDIGRASNRRR